MLVLQTERLDLRWFTAADAQCIIELLNDPGWIEHIGQRNVRTVAEAEAWIASRLTASYEATGLGFWAVALRETGELVGMCGLFKRDSLPDVDVGYALLPRHRGHGYVAEAVAACLAHGRDRYGLTRILAITGPSNAASQRVLERAGLRLEDRRVLEGETEETLVYAWSTS